MDEETPRQNNWRKPHIDVTSDVTPFNGLSICRFNKRHLKTTETEMIKKPTKNARRSSLTANVLQTSM